VRQWSPPKDVQAFGHAQDDTDAQAQADIHAPVEEGQDEQVKLFSAQEAEEPGRSFEPGGLVCNPAMKWMPQSRMGFMGTIRTPYIPLRFLCQT